MTGAVPANGTPYELAIDAVSDARYPLDADIIRRSRDPWTCPEHLLPYLAHALSVDLWDQDWPTAKKRAVIARSIALSRIKGTEAALAEAIEIVDGKLLSVIAPPATLYLSVTRTPAEKAAWLARMPQMRIYPQRLPARNGGLHVGQFLGYHSFTLKSEAFFQATPRVTIWRPGGGETDLLTLDRRLQDATISEAEEFVQAREPRVAPGMYLASAGPWYPQASTAASQVYTVRTRKEITIPGSTTLAAEFAGPGQEPIDVRAEKVREPAVLAGHYSGGAFLGVGLSRYLLNSRARVQVYKRVYLLDPSVPATAHTGRTFLGYNFRFGQSAYTADLKVAVQQARTPAAYQPFTYGYLVTPDTSAHRKTVEAIRTHQSLRDRILLNTRTKAVVAAGQGVTAGDGVIAGQLVSI